MEAHIWFIMEVYIKGFFKVPWNEVVLEFSSGKRKFTPRNWENGSILAFMTPVTTAEQHSCISLLETFKICLLNILRIYNIYSLSGYSCFCFCFCFLFCLFVCFFDGLLKTFLMKTQKTEKNNEIIQLDNWTTFSPVTGFLKRWKRAEEGWLRAIFLSSPVSSIWCNMMVSDHVAWYQQCICTALLPTLQMHPASFCPVDCIKKTVQIIPPKCSHFTCRV